MESIKDVPGGRRFQECNGQMTAKGAMPTLSHVATMLVGVALCSGLNTLADAATLPLPVRIEQIDSAIIGETREFWVSLPDRYPESGEPYPVIYMLDGEFNFNSGVIGGLRYAAQLGEIPEFIIVGIKNTNRLKDIFPEEITYGDGSKDGGRADQFLDFIRTELVPHIDKGYRTENFRVLYGTSNTGFTAVYALFRNPELANDYVAASATLRLPFFLAKRDQLISDFKGGKRQLALVMGERDLPTVLSQNGELKERFDLYAPSDLTCRLAVIRNDGHVPSSALLEGLRCLFEGWKITRPLTEKTFAEIRVQVDNRLKQYGVSGKLAEDELKGLGQSLLSEKKFGKAIEVLQYLTETYPSSVEALVSLGDAYRQNGNTGEALQCFKQALLLAPDHAHESSKLKGLDQK